MVCDLGYNLVVSLVLKKQSHSLSRFCETSQSYSNYFGYVRDVVDSLEDSIKLGDRVIGALKISWFTPPDGWFNVNSDGASTLNSTSAGCGGLIRDMNGHWLFGYAKALGYCSVFQAECSGMICGLY